MNKQKIIILPGNGNSDVNRDNWYSWVRGKLIGLGYYVVAKNMPDAELAHEHIWLPYIENELGADDDTIIIGHSSGGVATLRYLESHKLRGAVIIGVNHSDLGDANEQESGYYDTPWQWDKIKDNAGWIAQFASGDDPYIPLAEPEFIHQQLGSELQVIPGAGHYMTDKFPELVELIKTKVPLSTESV